MSRFFTALLIGLVIFLFLIYNFYYSVDFPFQDDGLLMRFVEEVTKKGVSVSIFFRELFRTENDHKAVIPKLIALADFGIDGHLNFKFYIILVSVNITYIFYFLYRQFAKFRLPLYYFIPAPFLFFHPLYHEISGWALTGMQHTFLTAFLVTAIYFAPRRFYLAMLFCFLATFSHGNGILSFGAVIFYFLCQKDFKKAGITLGFNIATLALYLANYEKGQAATLPTSLVSFLTSLFDFLGAGMSMWSYPRLFSALFGILATGVVVIVVFQVVIKAWREKKVFIKSGYAELLSLFAFIFATATIIAVFRSASADTIASRYQLYASLVMVIFYLLAVDFFSFMKKRNVLIIISALSIFYCAYSYYKFTATVASKRTFYLADNFNWKNSRNLFTMEVVGDSRFYLEPAYERGIFSLPKLVTEREEMNSLFLSNPIPAKGSGIYLEVWNLDRVENTGVKHLINYFISSKSFPDRKGLTGDRFLVFKNKATGELYLMSANPKVAARKEILTKGVYYSPGFNTIIRSTDLKQGQYALAILDVKDNGDKKFYLLDKYLDIESNVFFLK